MSDFPPIQGDVASQFRTNVVGWVSFTILVWDHFITIGDEVNYIWKGSKGPLVYLFFVNRYLTPLDFVVQWFAYYSPVLGTFERYLRHSYDVSGTEIPRRCNRFAVYEGVMFAVAIYISSFMMFFRIRALYPGVLWIQALLIALILFGIGLSCYDLSSTQAVAHSPDAPVQACYMIFGPDRAKTSTVQVGWPLIYDTFILGFTLYRILPSIRRKTSSAIVTQLFRDGLAYYFLIFCMALTLTVMVATAEDSIKNIMGQVEQLLTVAFMSRITLNLRKTGSKTHVVYFGDQGRVDQWHSANYTTDAGEISNVRFGPRSNFDTAAGTLENVDSTAVLELSPVRDNQRTSNFNKGSV